MNDPLSLSLLWHQLGWPLVRLLLFICIGLLAANLIEALNWTRKMAVLARPLIRFGRLSDITGAAFSMAFFSGVSANSMLAEAYAENKISRRELVLANLFNSLPTYFLHLPTTFFITLPLIKSAAFIYLGMTFGAAILRTLFISCVSRVLLSGGQPAGESASPQQSGRISFREALERAWKRLQKRIGKIIRFTVPIYILFFLLNRMGFFSGLERFLADSVPLLSWLSPQALSIVALHVAAEFTAGLAAAGALLQNGTLGEREVVLALLVGNILSSPIRAVRHQFPYYAGIFRPALAVRLIIFSQSFRTCSLAVVALGYFLLG